MLIRRIEVCRLVGLSARTIDRLEAAGDFPKRVRLGKNSVGWDDRDVLVWIERRKGGEHGGV